MFILYFCVAFCRIFFDLPINTTSPFGENIFSYVEDQLGFIDPFIWVEEACNYAYEEWETYVQNAQLYTTFLLFTRNSGSKYVVVNVGDVKLLIDGGFNVSKHTKIVIHGWLDNGTNSFAESLREAYQAGEDVNIVAVNWPDLSQSLDYLTASSAITPVGQYTASFVDFLVKEADVQPELIHLVGHSLGAHIAGVVGKFVTFGNLSRVTGLDPAKPLIPDSPDTRLEASDAHFVDVIHTTGDYLAFFPACGHVDFYPNGGTAIQPGCGMDIGFCSHRRAFKFFAESVVSLGFIATSCDSWSDYKEGICKNNSKVIMGEHVNTTVRGTYYLHTNYESPFAMGNLSAEEFREDGILPQH